MANKNCELCNESFTYEPVQGYPDKRKYCDKCSAFKKAQWEAKQNVAPVGNMPVVPQAQPVQEAKHEVILTRTDKPHSFEFGKAGQRHKIYYNNVADLNMQIAELINAGLHVIDTSSEVIPLE